MSYFPRHPFQRLLNDELPPSISGWGPFEMMGCFSPCGPRGPRPPYVMTPLGAQPMQQPQQYLPPPQASYYAPSPNANVAWLAAQQQQDYGGLPPNVDPSWNAPAPMPSGGPSMSFPGNVSLNGSADAYGDPNGGAAGFNVPAPHQDDLVKAAEQSQDDANAIFYGGAGAPRGPVVSGIVGALRSIRSLMHSQPQAGIGPVETTPQYLPSRQRGLGGDAPGVYPGGGRVMTPGGYARNPADNYGRNSRQFSDWQTSPYRLRRPLQQSSYPVVAGVVGAGGWSYTYTLPQDGSTYTINSFVDLMRVPGLQAPFQYVTGDHGSLFIANMLGGPVYGKGQDFIASYATFKQAYGWLIDAFNADPLSVDSNLVRAEAAKNRAARNPYWPDALDTIAQAVDQFKQQAAASAPPRSPLQSLARRGGHQVTLTDDQLRRQARLGNPYAAQQLQTRMHAATWASASPSVQTATPNHLRSLKSMHAASPAAPTVDDSTIFYGGAGAPQGPRVAGFYGRRW